MSYSSSNTNSNGMQFTSPAARLRALASKPLTNRQNQPIKINITQTNTFEKAIRNICSPSFVHPKFTDNDNAEEISQSNNVNIFEASPEANKIAQTITHASSPTSTLSNFRELVVNKEKNISNNEIESRDASRKANLIKKKELVDEINKNVIDKFYERTSNMIENKFNDFNKYINELTFNNATNSLASNSNVKQERSSNSQYYKINNNHLNKLSRLNDLIDLNSLKNKKPKKNKHKKRNSKTNASASEPANIEQARKSEDCEIQQDVVKSESYMEMAPSENNTQLIEKGSDRSSLTKSCLNQSEVDYKDIKTGENINKFPVMAVLAIDSEQRESGPAVIVTWNILRVDDQSLILNANDELLNTIEEYELYGYREKESSTMKTPKEIQSCLTLVNS